MKNYRRHGVPKGYPQESPSCTGPVTIMPQIQAGKRVLVAAHGNSIRALVKHLDNIPDFEITGLNIPTGFPLVYEIDDAFKPVRHYYLGNAEEIRQATDKVASQASKK